MNTCLHVCEYDFIIAFLTLQKLLDAAGKGDLAKVIKVVRIMNRLPYNDLYTIKDAVRCKSFIKISMNSSSCTH
jgi:hypothetical protein